MPLFECPRCGKRGLIPLAFCDSFLEGTPFIQPEDGTEIIYVVKCPECNNNRVTVVEGDLLEQPVDVIVNARNRNVIPWWLLLPQGVSGAIKRRAWHHPFQGIAASWCHPLGRCRADLGRSAAPTRASSTLPGSTFCGVHRSGRSGVLSAVPSGSPVEHGDRSIAFPLIGAGSGGFDPERAKAIMLEELKWLDYSLEVRVVVLDFDNLPASAADILRPHVQNTDDN